MPPPTATTTPLRRPAAALARQGYEHIRMIQDGSFGWADGSGERAVDCNGLHRSAGAVHPTAPANRTSRPPAKRTTHLTPAIACGQTRNSRDRQHVCPCSASECWRRLLITLRLVLILTGKFHTPASQFAGTTGPTLPNARTLLQVVPTPRLLPDTDGSSCIIPGAVSTGAAVFLWNRPADAPTSARHNQQAAPQAASPVMVSHAGPGAPDWGIPAMRLGYPHLLSGPGRPCFHRSTSLIAHPSPRTGNDRLGGCFASGSGRNAALHVAVEGRWRDVARVHGPAARAQSREGAQNWPAQVQEGAGPAFEDTVVCWRDAGGIRGARRHRHNPKASLVPPRMFAAARVTGGQGCMRSRGHSGARAPRTCTRARFAGSCAQSEALHCSLKARGRRDAAGCVTGSRGLVLACCRRCCPPPKFA